MRSLCRAHRSFPHHSKDGRVWETIESRKIFLMQIYEKERIYKSGYHNLEIV